MALHPKAVFLVLLAAACDPLSQPGCCAALVALFLGVPGLFHLLSVMVLLVVGLCMKAGAPVAFCDGHVLFAAAALSRSSGWVPLGLFSAQLFKEQL